MTITAGDWQVESLQPLKEIRAEHETAGNKVPLADVVDLAEMGVPAGLIGTVKSITACPTIQSGDGRVVLATVNHLNNFVFHLTLTNGHGDNDTLGVTGYHRFYTEDRGWVIASDLTQGEVVRTAHGDVTVSALVRDPGAFTVYNMTVEADQCTTSAICRRWCIIRVQTMELDLNTAATHMMQPFKIKSTTSLMMQTIFGKIRRRWTSMVIGLAITARTFSTTMMDYITILRSTTIPFAALNMQWKSETMTRHRLSFKLY